MLKDTVHWLYQFAYPTPVNLFIQLLLLLLFILITNVIINYYDCYGYYYPAFTALVSAICSDTWNQV